MKQHIISVLIVAVLSIAVALPALAEGRHEGRGDGRDDGRHGMHQGVRPWGGPRDIRHFEDRHRSVWVSGRWHHGPHEGRVGWWWIVAGTWYFYPWPVYPYPDPYIPPVVVVQPAPAPETAPPEVQPQAQVQNWYYCEASKSYYPYVSSCPAGWKEVPATPPAPRAK